MADPADEKARLSGARGEFVASLGRRLQTLRQALRELEEAPDDRSRRDSLLRRVHALGAAARVLGFASVAEALQEAERALAERQRPRTKDLAEVSRVLDVLPSLVWGAPQSLRPGRPPSAAPEALAGRKWPLSLLLYGSEELAVILTRAVREGSVEFERAEQVEAARRAARALGPDLLLVDADHPEARAFLGELRGDELSEPVNSIVIGHFTEPEAMREFSALGASRILKKPCNPETLRRTIEELSEAAQQRVSHNKPLGDITLPGLTRRIQSEVKRGLLDAAVAGAQNTHVALGEGTDVMAAVWGALTRVRELVTLHSKGQIRFEPTGPEGAIPVAPWSNEERRAGERAIGSTRDESEVPLAGRTVVVADDDPAVAWFLSGLLKTVGAEVVEAHDGFKALELARQGWPDLVVSDILMPGLDGFSLCRQLKNDVAVRDVPVILLSWKEDLLQRVRELGAEADGYLRKEAAASTVVQRIREVMRARARVEARLKQGGEVRGRLDGLTPRLVLELCTSNQADVRIEVVDAFHRYVLHVRRGQLVAAGRVLQGVASTEADAVHGSRVVSSLLGVNAGRFLVAPDDSPVTAEFSGTLKDVLKPAIDRARVVQAALASDRLAAVTRVHFLEEELETYLTATPDPMKTALMQLAGGMSPRQLLLGGVSAALLERTLLDVARRGCITRIEGPPGPERDAESAEESEAAASGSTASAAVAPGAPAESAPVPEESSASPGLGSQALAPADSATPADSWPEPAPRASGAARQATVQTPPPDSLDAIEDPPEDPSRGPPATLDGGVGTGGSASFPAEPEAASAPATHTADAESKAPEPPAPAPIPPAPEPGAHPSSQSQAEADVKEAAETIQTHSKAAFSFQLSPEPPAPLSGRSGPESIEEIDDGAWFVSDSGVGAEQVNAWPPESGTLPGVGDEERRSPEEVETRTPPPTTELGPRTAQSPRGGEAARAVSEANPSSTGSDAPQDFAPDLASAIARSTLEPPPEPRARLKTKKSVTLPATKSISFPKTPPGPEPVRRPDGDDDAEQALALGATVRLGADEAGEAKARPEEEPADSGPDPVRTLLLGEAAPTPPPKPARVRPSSPVVLEPARGEAASAPPASAESKPTSARGGPSAAESEPEAAPAHADADEREPAGEQLDEESELDEEAPAPEPRSPRPRARARARVSERPSAPAAGLGKVGLAVVVVASAAVSYLVVTSVQDWLGGPTLEKDAAPAAQRSAERAPAAQAPSAPKVEQLKSQLSAPAPARVPGPKPSAAASGEAATAHGEPVSVSEESLPQGMALAAGKGVLKVVTSGAHAIYVDGEFAGRGPVRIVPLPPGQHQVRTRLEGEENTYSAEVKQGRLTRLAVGNP